MSAKIGIILDPIIAINPQSDSSIALMLEAQRRNWEVWIMEQQHLYQEKKDIFAAMSKIKIYDNHEKWYQVEKIENQKLQNLDFIFIRKDPPFDQNYLYTTLLLDTVVKKGGKVINSPSGIREANEKLFSLQFSSSPDSLVTADFKQIEAFLYKYKTIVIKGLTSFKGKEVFLIKFDDPNKKTLIEKMTNKGQRLVLVQQYIHLAKKGDKRIFLINGIPIDYGLLRIPKEGDFRGNVAAGASIELSKLNKTDYAICEEMAPVLKQKGLYFVGIDVVGDYCMEINVTSPTCIKEIDRLANINIAEKILDNLMFFKN